MGSDEQAKAPGKAARSVRDERLGRALRENLLRRKAQRRGRAAPACEAGEDAGEEPAGVTPADSGRSSEEP